MTNPTIDKIKAYRAATGCGLREAHDAIRAGRDIPSPENADAERDALDRMHDERKSLQSQIAALEAKLVTIVTAAETLRAAQRAYMADRGNDTLGKAVGTAATALDEAIALIAQETDK